MSKRTKTTEWRDLLSFLYTSNRHVLTQNKVWKGKPLHNSIHLIKELGQIVSINQSGLFRFSDIFKFFNQTLDKPLAAFLKDHDMRLLKPYQGITLKSDNNLVQIF